MLAQTLWIEHEKLLTSLCPELTLQALSHALCQTKANLLHNSSHNMAQLANFLSAKQLSPERLWPLLPSLRACLLSHHPHLSCADVDAFCLALAAALQSLFCQIHSEKELGHFAFLGKHFAFLLHEIAGPLAVAETSAFRLQQLLSSHPPLAMQPLECLQAQLASLVETLRQIRMLTWEKPHTLQTCLLVPGIQKALGAFTENGELQVHTEGFQCPGAVRGEATQLGWVWKNLLENAVRAMKGRGNLLVRVESTPPHAFVFVEDSGPGIEEPLRKHLFEPFVSTYAQRPGLGLALAKTIVERHGGCISLQQSRWGGACFAIRLQHAPPPLVP